MPPNEFARIARSWGYCFHHVARTALAIRTPDGVWALQHGFIAFTPEEIPVPELYLETKSILAIRESNLLGNAGSAAIESVLSDTTSIQIGGRVLNLPAAGAPAHETYHCSHLPRLPGPLRLPSITITRQGNASDMQTLPTMTELDLELKAYSTPYDGLGELISELGTPFPAQEMGISALPRIEIVIWPPARIHREDIKNGELLVEVHTSPEIDRSKLVLGLRVFPLNENKVQHIPFSGDTEWQITPQNLTSKFRQGLHDIGLVQSYLSYDGEFLGSSWARDESATFNARMALHKAIDSDNAFVTKFFNDRKDFEEHILVLFSLLKLDCLYYGKIADLTDGPDILARSDQNHLYVIECTTGDINSKGKLRRLYERTNNIRAALANSVHRPREVLAVMVTSSTKAETLHCSDELTTYKIALVCREDIDWLLTQIEAPPSADRLFAAAIATIPSANVQASN